MEQQQCGRVIDWPSILTVNYGSMGGAKASRKKGGTRRMISEDHSTSLSLPFAMFPEQ
jgi:hypothetical protein